MSFLQGLEPLLPAPAACAVLLSPRQRTPRFAVTVCSTSLINTLKSWTNPSDQFIQVQIIARLTRVGSRGAAINALFNTNTGPDQSNQTPQEQIYNMSQGSRDGMNTYEGKDRFSKKLKMLFYSQLSISNSFTYMSSQMARTKSLDTYHNKAYK